MINSSPAQSTLCLLEWHVTPFQTSWHFWTWYKNANRILMLFHHDRLSEHAWFIHDVSLENTHGEMSTVYTGMIRPRDSNIKSKTKRKKYPRKKYLRNISTLWSTDLLKTWSAPWPSLFDQTHYSETVLSDLDSPALFSRSVRPSCSTKE